jgi:hypothetical protein
MAAALAALVPCLAERSCGPASIGRIVSASLVGAHMALVDLALEVARAPKQWREVWDHLVLAALLRNANGQKATLTAGTDVSKCKQLDSRPPANAHNPS